MTAKTGNVSLSALADNRSFDVAVAGAATLGTAALTGTVLTTVSRTEATAELGQAVTVRADDSVGVVADASGTLASVGGAGTVSAGAIGAGATVNTVIVENAVTAQVGDLADLIGPGGNVHALPLRRQPGGHRHSQPRRAPPAAWRYTRAAISSSTWARPAARSPSARLL